MRQEESLLATTAAGAAQREEGITEAQYRALAGRGAAVES